MVNRDRHARSRLRPWYLLCAGLLTPAACSLLDSPTPSSAGGNSSVGAWLPQAEAANFTGVWGSASNNVFAVASDGSLWHYDGTTWQAMTGGTIQVLSGTWGSGASDVFAVGENGTILRYDGVSWTAQPNGTPQGQDLRGVWGTSRTDVFAVGGNAWPGGGATILHYDGTTWSTLPSGTTQDLLAVWGRSASDVFVVGYGGILHYNGSSWSPQAGRARHSPT